MSRDFAPIHHYLSEQKHLKEGYGDLFDFLENLKIVYNNKEEICCTPEEMAIRRQFPQLGRLFMDYGFIELYNKLSKIEGGIQLLRQKDEELKRCLDSKGTDCDKESYLIKWFYGKLDERFYYHERNDELLVEFMCNEALTLCLFNDLKKQIESHENETSYGEPQAWAGLSNGRSIEIVLEQEGLPTEEYYYSLRLHCNEAEYDDGEYHAANGVVDKYNSTGADIEELKELISIALSCNERYPVKDEYLPDNFDKPILNDVIREAESKVDDKITDLPKNNIER